MKEIVSDFKWSQNPLKLQRAIAKAKIDTNTDGTEYTEEAVMEWYKKLGGNVVGKIEKKLGRPKKDETSDLVPETE